MITGKRSTGSTPQPGELPTNADDAWRHTLWLILNQGQEATPRGQPTLEVLHQQLISYDMARPVVTSPQRDLNYGFMAAEARWIIDGSNELARLTRHVKRMVDFSDDGQTLAGAYGPRIGTQKDYVVQALLKDPWTRQAVLSIWTPIIWTDEPPPPMSKDVPCTIAMAFTIRRGRLHQHVFMRSSDAWLGVPYDMFSFAMIGIWVACAYNRNQPEPGQRVMPGAVTISATSSHLYLRDKLLALDVLASEAVLTVGRLSEELVLNGAWDDLYADLQAVDDGKEPTAWRFIP